MLLTELIRLAVVSRTGSIALIKPICRFITCLSGWIQQIQLLFTELLQRKLHIMHDERDIMDLVSPI